MALFTTSRHKGPGRFLREKTWLFTIAAILMLVGMARGIDLLILAAIVLLAVAFLLRFFEKDPPDEEEYDDEEWDEDDDRRAADLPSPTLGEMHRRADDVVEEPRRPLD